MRRQLLEAVRIGRRGEGNILNSKAEYNRSRIARLSLGESTPALEDPATEGKEDLEKEVQCWEGRMNARETKSLNNYRRKYTSEAVNDTKMTNKRSKDDLVESMEEDLVKGKA